MNELDRDGVLAWLAGLADGPWLELMTSACQRRQARHDGESRFAVAHIWRFDRDEPWVVELIAVEDEAHYLGRFAAEDCTVIRSATCSGCGIRVGSWARVVHCPVCGESLSCH